MARRVLLFSLTARCCFAVDPLQPPGGTFQWGSDQPVYSWNVPAPAAPAAPASQANGLLPNPPQPPAAGSGGQGSFWNLGGQSAGGQVHHSHSSSSGGTFWNSAAAQGQPAHTTHIHVSQTIGGGGGGSHLPPPHLAGAAEPLPAGGETVAWKAAVETTTTAPNPMELPQPDAPHFEVETDLPDGSPLASCKGYEEHWAQCTQPSCTGVERVNCAFSAWSQWESLGGCSGLGLRSRKIARHHANGGTPCNGVKEETKEMDQFFGEGCLIGDRDCQWGDWSDWSHCGCEVCGEDRKAQKVKYRKIVKQAYGNGAPCTGNFNLTEPCAPTEKPQDCELSDWGEWTRCSATCNGGVRASMRRVMKEADYGGSACESTLRKTESCGTQSCDHHVDCVIGQWGAWHGCSVPGTVQMTRQRQIESYAKGDGEACDAPLTETAGCENRDDLQWCDISAWSPWSTCPVACGGGQQMRVRHLRSQQNCFPLAREDLKEIRGCNTDSCNFNGGCEMSSWSAWGACSQECGIGVSVRSRNIDKAAENGGKSCMASLKEMKDCENEPCPIRDCLWAAWDHWSGCSCTCGGGLKRRARTVQVAPRAGGALCEPSDKLQVEPCNTHPCGDCVDGKWTSWSMWSECTATCSPAYRWRHRSVAERNNDCGKPVTGLEEEYEMCSTLDNCTQDQDCTLSEWEDWNGCSCSCYGVTERHRHVKLLAIGKGKRCEESSLKEFAPCNPALNEERPSGCRNEGPQNCTFSSWESWSMCSKECGGGERTRMRSIKAPLNHNGAPCEGELAEISPCNTFFCADSHCVDCQWGAWSEWGDCSACSGQKYRQRIIANLQNDCGHKCEPGAAKETMNCTGVCEEEVYCRWGEWSDHNGECTASCGTSVRIVQRRLEITNVVPTEDDYNETLGGNYLFAGSSSMICSGEQSKTVECDTKPCDESCYPVPCLFGAWNEWSEPSCTQLCNRDRVIAQRSQCGGQSCHGPQTETKVCPRKSCIEAVDCAISEWDEWSYCSKDTPGSNRVRARSILAEAQNGGKACGTRYPAPPLALEEIEPCVNWKEDSSVTDCVLTTWGQWTECTALCNGGLRHRNRGIRTPPAAGGVPCQGSLEELEPCNLGKCGDQKERDCKFSPWNDWSHCDSHDQRERYRLVAVEPLMDGKPCNGSLKEIRPCTIAVDCVISPWTPWDQCDKSCDGGQKQRQRQVELNPKHGGKPCPLGLIETVGCNREPCDDKEVNCKVSTWSVWSRCSASCGPGVKERQRTVTNRLSHCGAGCVGNLTQVEPCYLEHCGGCDPCAWGDWREWSECDVHCGGGQRIRLRNITVWPSPGCPPCEAMNKEELGGCNLEPCPDSELCVDGAWSTWNDWEACSTSCEGGMRWRVRHVARKATSCGQEPTGDSREEEECNKGVPCKASQDCMLSAWSVWSDCSASCHGVKKRERSVEQHGYGAGKYCEGVLEEAFPCALGISRSLVDWSSTHLYLNLHNVFSNNLGGQGPDFQAEQALRFKNAAADNAQSVDLLVRVAEESDYRPEKGSDRNGLAGEFGNIFVGRDSEVVVDIELVDSYTNDAVAAEDFVIKFFDGDSGVEGSDITTYSITAVDECEEFYNTPDSVFKVHGSCAEPGLTEFEKPFISVPWCDTGGFDVLDLGRVINSNLMGKGPDHQGKPDLHFENVMTVDGAPVDLVIEVVTGEYEPGDPQANGAFGGRTQFNQAAAMGAISLATGTMSKFKASFKRSDGFAVYVPKLNLTFWDIDMPLDNLRERVAIFGYKKFYTLDQLGHETEGNSVAYMHKPGGGEFSSGRLQVTEPMDPMHPTRDQRDVAITFFFENVAEFFFELEVTWIGASSEASDSVDAQRFFFSATACSGNLPDGYRGYESSRRLQVFNVPWLPQAPVTNVVHQAQQQAQVAAQAAAQAASGNVMDQVQKQIHHVIKDAGVDAGSTPSHEQRAAELQNQEVVVYKSSSPNSICPDLPRPVPDWSPTSQLPSKESEAIAIRFERQSRIRLRLKTGKEGCGHNFMFAAKACLSGHCDPCAIGSTCVFKSWEEWGSCTEACEGGVEERKRGVMEGAASSHGAGCDGALVSVRSCNTQSCNQNCQPVNCKWAKWGQWSTCSKCAGQKTRSRRVARTPECGGRRCEAGDAEEIAKCPRNCLGEPICEWSEWSAFSPCSVSCGCGRKKRTRRLQKVIHQPPELTAAYEKLERLDGHVQKLENKRWKARVLAFLAGPSVMFLAFAMLRVSSRRAAGRLEETAETPFLPDPEQANLVEMSTETGRSMSRHLNFDPL